MIENAYFWQIIFLLAIGTFTIRFSFIGLSSRVSISARMKEIFSFIPASVLPALVAPMVFFHQGKVDWLLGKERFLVLLVACFVTYYFRSMLATIVFGLTSLYLLTHL